MNTLTKKLGLAVLVGLVIIALTWGLTQPDQRPHLLIDAIKHLGVIIIGIAAVEVVWVWAGGSPTELDLKSLIGLNRELSVKMKEDVEALSKGSAEIREASTRIEEAMQRMTTIVQAANRTGLANVGTAQEELGYPPGRFADELRKARDGIDLCGCTLALLHSNDALFDALVETANRGVPVRILLSSPQGDHLVAMFKDRFEETIRQGSRALTARIMASNSKIQLKLLGKKALTICMLRIDEVMLVVPYMYSSQTPESPRFEIKGSKSPLFGIYQAEFQALFDLAVPPSDKVAA
jgi:hypothetical protein